MLEELMRFVKGSCLENEPLSNKQIEMIESALLPFSQRFSRLESAEEKLRKWIKNNYGTGSMGGAMMDFVELNELTDTIDDIFLG